ncbi:MAG: condensin subunit MukF [Bradymonadaceae bacterium]|nr:condensin subunit MukF [Lujinxingiaceae bacterium]
MTDVHRLIGALAQANAALTLETTELCFLIALRERGTRLGLTAFEEEVLFDVYEQICDLTEGAVGNPRKRATHALQRLREQRLLGRVDGAGLVRAGDYALTRLASAIVEFFLEDEALTRESLTVLTKTLLSQLAQVRLCASRAETIAQWREEVIEPLRVAVGDLVGGIERRARGLDAHQESVREQIAGLLQKDWFASVDACEALLEETTATLKELTDVLLRDTAHLQALLQEIEDFAGQAGAEEAEDAAQKVMGQIDRVVAWSANRQGAWSDYYQFVQRYLRSVVRLDPDRALSQRLREQLAVFPDNPYFLVYARGPRLRVLREPETRPVQAIVKRQSQQHERPLEQVPLDRGPVSLEDRVQAALDAGALSLSEVLEWVLPELGANERFRAAGRIAELLARTTRISSPWERSWVPVGTELEVEEWTVDAGERR